MANDRKFDISSGRFVNRVSGEEIPDDEPVMIFRGRDSHAADMIAYYFTQAQDPHHRAAIAEVLADFARFALDHSERMKEPGVTRHIMLDRDRDN